MQPRRSIRRDANTKPAKSPTGRPPAGPPSPTRPPALPQSQDVLSAQVEMYQAIAMAANAVTAIMTYMLEHEREAES